MLQPKPNVCLKIDPQLLSLLQEAMTFLSNKQRTVLHLRFWENNSILQISNRIGLNWAMTDMFIDDAISHLRYRIFEISKKNKIDVSGHHLNAAIAA